MIKPQKKWLLIVITNLTVFLLALFAVKGLSPAQPPQQVEPLRITSPADGTVVAPGQTITVMVAIAPNATFDPLVYIAAEDPLPISELREAPPYQFSIPVPKDISPGKYWLIASGGRKPVTVHSKSITIDVEKPESISELRAEPTRLDFGFPGGRFPLRVVGIFSDGSAFDISHSTRLTFSSDDVAVVTVNDEGLVTAVGAGPTNVIVSYGSRSLNIPVSVPRTIPGDLNGNGRVDQNDLNIILDALNTPAVGPFDARDLNKDGVINMSDAKQLISLCTSQCNTINIPPDVSQARPSIATLWPPNHRMVPVSVLGVSDPDGDSFSIRIDTVTQDEPTNGLGDGDTCPDGEGVGTSTAQLRAERSGTGQGRVYTIFFTAEDLRGGKSQGTVQVCVPHDEHKTCEFTGFNSKPAGDSTVCRP